MSEERSDDMSAGIITSPSSIRYALKRAPSLHRLVLSLEHRYDNSVKVDCIFSVDAEGSDFNVQIEKIDYSHPDTVKFSGFAPKSGASAVGEYNLRSREGTIELFL